MLRQEMTPKKIAAAVGLVVLLCVLAGGSFSFLRARQVKAAEAQMNWQRDREMGVPNLGLSANATEEEKEVAKTRMMERQLTRERESAAAAGY